MGYWALLFGSALKGIGGRKFLGFEASPKFASVSRALIELAGLGLS